MFDGLMRPRSGAGKAEVAEPTPREIARKVHRHKGLIAADSALQALRREKRQIRADVVRLIHDRHDPASANYGDADVRLRQLEEQEHTLAERVRPCFAAVAAERPAFIARVNEALAGTRHNAARRAATAIAELMAAVAILDACNAEVQAVGGEPVNHPPLQSLAELDATMRRRGGIEG